MPPRQKMELADWIASLETVTPTGEELALVSIVDPESGDAVPAKLPLSQFPAGQAPGVVTPFIATFVTPSVEFIVNHNLGHRPIVDVVTNGGVRVEADVVHVSFNQVRVNFASPFAGSVICL